jgi:mevalonate kinase
MNTRTFNSGKEFFAKVLLFGEYAVMNGGEAVTVPLKLYSGHFDFADSDSANERTALSAASLKNFMEHLSTCHNFDFPINISQFRTDLEQGMFFNSTIPQGYGTGSSGALVAAVFDRYSSFHLNPGVEMDAPLLNQLKWQFSLMESWFHGNSSGIDPLSCYMGKPIHLDNSGTIQIHDMPLPKSESKTSCFLLDTGIAGMTSPLVEWFKTRCEMKELDAGLLKTLSNEAIKALLAGNTKMLFNYLDQLSLFQLENMKPTIPKNARYIWFDGLETRLYTLKLCGSGGGGFILGFTVKPAETSRYFEEKGINLLWLSPQKETRTT